MISRIVLQNFKRFTTTEILCNGGKNIFIGENGAGINASPSHRTSVKR